MVKLDLTPIEYTEQDRHNEGCCWDYVRQLCPGGGCLCNCHATNEEILLSDRATLRRQVVTLRSQLAARDAEAARLREALLENVRSIDVEGRPCWCADDFEVHYPHLSRCRMARAALAAPTSGDADADH